MKHSSISKPLSVLLSILMVLSIFAGMTFTAGAEAVTPKYKIMVGNDNSMKAISNSAALPVSTTVDVIMSKIGAAKNYTFNSIKHKSGPTLCSFSGKNVQVNGYGVETLVINATKKDNNKKYNLAFRIEVTPLTSCVCEAVGYTGTYDGEAHTIEGLTVTSPESGATVKYGTVSGTYNLTEAPSFTDAGTHTVYYQVAASGWVTKTGSVDVVIAPKPITVTAIAQTKMRGADDPALTYTVEGLLGDAALTGELTREEGEALGDYQILQGTLAADDNYVIEYVGANLTVEPNADDLAAANVATMIDAIGDVELSDECKEKIDAAQAAYDALTDEQKALVPNTAVLTEAQTAYAELKAAAEALEQAKSMMNNALQVAENLVGILNDVGYTEIAESLNDAVNTAKEALAAADATAETVNAAREVLMAATADAYNAKNAADAAAQLEADKAAFEDYKAERKAAVEALAQEGDSESCAALIKETTDAIDALTYDENKTLAENKAAVDETASPETLSDRLEALRHTAKAEEPQSCPYCGGSHSGVLGALITALHGIVWLLINAFRLDSSSVS